MEDYPRTLAKLEARFSFEQACREYLFPLWWPEGFRCPRCGGTKAWPLRSILWRRASCVHEVSVTAGTIFAGHARPTDNVVAGDLVGDHPEERRQRSAAEAGVGPGKLSNRLGVAA